MENARQLNLWLLVTQYKQKKHFAAVDTNLKVQFVDTYLSGHYYKHESTCLYLTFHTGVATASQLKHFLIQSTLVSRRCDFSCTAHLS